jgi:hypothetical protein
MNRSAEKMGPDAIGPFKQRGQVVLWNPGQLDEFVSGEIGIQGLVSKLKNMVFLCGHETLVPYSRKSAIKKTRKFYNRLNLKPKTAAWPH